MSLFSNLFSTLTKKKQSQTGPQIITAPEFSEAQGARGLWWQKLQDWGGQPGYGAIAPNWADVWGMAKKRVSEHYQGTATMPGAMDRVKASAARRGVSGSPALETQIARLGAEEGSQLSDIATNQSIQEAQFSETGRQNWLSSLSGLADQKPASSYVAPYMQYREPNKWAQFSKDSEKEIMDFVMRLFGGGTGGPNMTSTGIRVPSTYTPPY